MKSSVVLTIMICAGIMAADARAQDASIEASMASLNAERPASQRIPKMVIYESPAAIQQAKPSAQAPGGAARKGSVKPQAAGDHAQGTPAPLVFSGAQPAINPQLAGALETSGNPAYDEIVLKAAARHGVDPNLIFAVMRQESGFNWRARSHKGATGLMQLMPATARRFGVRNIYDPAENIEGGTRYLRFLLDTFNGDVELALAGYNAGEGAVVKYGYQVPRYRETQNYVRSITARYGRTRRAGAAVPRGGAARSQPPDAVAFSGGSSTRLSNNY